MATDAPDWQGLRWKVEATIKPNQRFRSGTLLLIDDFESTSLKWSSVGSAGSSAAISTDNPYNGDSSLKMVTTAVANETAVADRCLSTFGQNKIGIELNACFYTNNTGSEFEVALDNYSGSVETDAAIRIDLLNSQLLYKNSAGAYVTIDTNFKPLYGNNAYHGMKLIADFGTKKYERFLFDDKSYSLSAYGMRQVASTTRAQIDVRLIARNKVASSRTHYIDDIIFTEE